MSQTDSKIRSLAVLLAPWLVLMAVAAAAGIYFVDRLLISPQSQLEGRGLQFPERFRPLACSNALAVGTIRTDSLSRSLPKSFSK